MHDNTASKTLNARPATEASTRRGLLVAGGAGAIALGAVLGGTPASAKDTVGGRPSGTAGATVNGTVLPGYEAVRAAFERNLASGDELGGAFAVYRDGRPVVDLWGGMTAKDRSVAVKPDTLYGVFSTTKGLTSICIAMLVQRGKLGYDAPVTRYWPEFGAAGKSAVTVGELMSHQAGLVSTRVPATMDDYYAHDPVAKALASQEPYFRPGQWGYHAQTIGTLADELVRRTDGRTVKRFFAEEVAPGLDGDVFMGLPAEQDGRHAGVTGSLVPGTQFFDSPNPPALMASMTNPMVDWDWPNQRHFREQGHPAVGASANARGLAKLYASLVADEGADGLNLLDKATLTEATRERICGIDQGSGGVGRYAAGFRLNTGGHGPNPASYGHPGLGGTAAFADPTRKLGVAYTTTRMLLADWQGLDPRLGRLLAAFYTADAKR